MARYYRPSKKQKSIIKIFPCEYCPQDHSKAAAYMEVTWNTVGQGIYNINFACAEDRGQLPSLQPLAQRTRDKKTIVYPFPNKESDRPGTERDRRRLLNELPNSLRRDLAKIILQYESRGQLSLDLKF